jgi:hypothetical protein
MSSKIGVSSTTSTGAATWSAVADKRRTVGHAKNTVKITSVHEHNLVPTMINEMKYFHCITCGTIYCELCGKSLEASATHNHQVDKFRYSDKIGLAH